MVISITGWISLLFYPALCWLTIEYFNIKALFPGDPISNKLAEQIYQHSKPFLFGILLCYLIFAILTLLARWCWIAIGVQGGVILLFGFINYMKITLNGVPFLPADLSLAGEMNDIASFVSVPPPKGFWIALIVLIGWIGVLILSKNKVPGKRRVSGTIGIFLAAVLAFSLSGSRGQWILSRFDMSLNDSALQTNNYVRNGFLGGFTINLVGLHVEEPSGYSMAAIDRILEGCTAKEVQSNYDIIIVLSESFFDLRKLPGATYSENMLENYDSILASDNCISGDIYTIALGGGTVNTEFRVLTGLSTDKLLPQGATPYHYVHKNLDSYVWNYKRQGYRTMGLHLFNPNFYSRKQTYPYLGFDSFYSIEEAEADGIEFSYTRNYATDITTEQAIEHYMNQAEVDGFPAFLFAITIENHQPYTENPDNTIAVTAPALGSDQLLALTTYAQGAKDADQMLGALRRYIDNRNRPTVLVWFGDHLPTLAQAHDPYRVLGYYDNDGSTEQRARMFSTPFLVYSNQPLSQGLFPERKGNQISDIYLMTCVASATGGPQTPFTDYLGKTLSLLPVYNMKLNMDKSLTSEQSKIVNDWWMLAYDRIVGKGYSNDLK